MTYRILPAALPLVIPSGLEVPDGYAEGSKRAWSTAEDKVTALVRKHPDRFPLYTTGGRWQVEGEAWTNWCEGFLGGQLWMLAERTGRPDLRELAEHYSRLIEERKYDRNVHDLGFLFWSTWRRWYEATGSEELNETVVQAGRTMSLRFNEKGRYLRSFLSADSLFIDIMMNVGIVFYAAQQTGDENLARIAYEHCLTTRRTLVRGDGSASHEGIFDLDTGAFLRQSTQQGFSDDGSWARGQGWGMYGFGTAYRYTGDRRFLRTAQDCADFYLERTGAALVPPNDWEEPHPVRSFESSAAAIAAGGMWQLAGLVEDETRARGYANYALRILTRLCEPDFLSYGDPAWEGVLQHGSYHEGKGLGVDESVMWGDYWFLDALDGVDRHLADLRDHN
ncbi:glycoside hydrolase family 88 protein [Micromonospora purpureochromogenes]|uniref:glycoside hydrolase family 88 protein n=1 Tax=Micromonospora purpureochromogenes TaxID=47872 RepID=UPI0033CB6C4B